MHYAMIPGYTDNVCIKRKKAYLAIFVFVAIGIIIRFIALPDAGSAFHTVAAVGSCILMPFLWEGMMGLTKLLDLFLPYRTGIKRRIFIQLFASIIVLTILQIGYFAIIYPFVINYIPPEFYSRPLLAILSLTNILVITSINLAHIGRYFFEQWKTELVNNERLQKERSQVQFDNLKNQLNPHFLFNALTSLNSLIFENQQLACDFVQQLSKVYRYVLQNKDKELVTLQTELLFIKQYTKLMQTRFYGALEIEFTIDESALDTRIVPVTLQILIENATKHNILNEQNPLRISIYTESEGDGQCLFVQNNLQRKYIVETSNGTGLNNLKTLYQYLSPRSVEIVETPNSFALKLPLL